MIGHGGSGEQVLSVADTLALFVKADGCSTTAIRDTLPARVPSDHTIVHYIESRSGQAGTAVALYTIDVGGHTWPGKPSGRIYAVIGGHTTETIYATQLMWDFFAQHPKP